ncbi:MAG: hypothetical protein ACRDJP_02450, partial [Actinomycetota bacterium]
MEVAARDPWDWLGDVERRKRELNAEMLDAVAELEARWPDDPCIPDLSSELARVYGWSQHVARERIRIASALRELPEIRRAHGEGRLSWNQLRWVTGFATPETDDDWARRAPRMTPNQLRLEARRQRRVRPQEADSDHTRRGLWTSWDDEGSTLYGEVQLAREQGVAFERAVLEAAKRTDMDPGAEDARAARQADALVDLVTSSSGRPERPTVVVHTDAEALTGTHDGTRRLSETASGIQLHAEAIRRM